MTLLDIVETEKKSYTKIRDVTQDSTAKLVDDWYIEERTAKRVKVREIRDPEICRLTYTLPRGNEQAEHWYWRVLSKQKHLDHFDKAGILSGDILKIMSYYAGQEDKYILANW